MGVVKGGRGGLRRETIALTLVLKPLQPSWDYADQYLSARRSPENLDKFLETRENRRTR